MRRFVSSFPWLAAGLAAALLVIVSLQKRELNRYITEDLRAEQVAQVGDHIPTFAARTTSGDTIIIGHLLEREGRQVVFLLTAACQFCRRTLPSWKAIASALRSADSLQIQSVALTTDSLPVAVAFADSQNLSVPLVPFPERKLAALSHASIVPQTWVLDSNGLVLYSRRGVIETQAGVDSVVGAAMQPMAGQLRRTP